MAAITPDLRAGEPPAPPAQLPVAGRHPIRRYTLRRIGSGLLVLVLVSVFVFLATNVLPGDAAQAILGRNATPETVSALRIELGLDAPLVERYGEWIGGILRGDLGDSFSAGASVSSLIGDRLQNSLVLALAAFLVMVPIALVLGVLAGIRTGSAVDHATSVVGLVGIAVPDYVWGTLLALVFGVALQWLPPVSITAGGQSPLGDPELLVLPVLTLLIVGLAYLVRMVRAGMADVMASAYVEQARLSGIRERRLIFRHALRNALAPSVQMLALTLQWLVGGVIVVETVFAYPGIGLGLVQAVQARDMPYVQTVALLIAAIYIGINIVADLLVVYLVPRLRTGGAL